jgi:hypothetical protein
MDLTGSVFQGVAHRGPILIEGQGEYKFPNGNIYKGEFKDGLFDGEGILYIAGKGKYVGVWDKGRVVSVCYFVCFLCRLGRLLFF